MCGCCSLWRSEWREIRFCVCVDGQIFYVLCPCLSVNRSNHQDNTGSLNKIMPVSLCVLGLFVVVCKFPLSPPPAHIYHHHTSSASLSSMHAEDILCITHTQTHSHINNGRQDHGDSDTATTCHYYQWLLRSAAA